MKGFVGDIEDLTEQNADFRRVLYTGKKLQLVVMALEPGEDIGEEVHSNIKINQGIPKSVFRYRPPQTKPKRGSKN